MKINIKNLTKSFNGTVVLNNIDLQLEDVHSLVIIGPSGGGKSTLLRIIAGLEKPDSGHVEINGKKLVFGEKQLREYRKTVGMVFQAYNLFPHLTAIENITLPLNKIHKIPQDKAESIAKDLLKRFRLLEHAYKKPAQLSGGQKQRVAIARALSINPQFLLLDEPTSALDPDLTREVLDSISELRKENKDLILVTHEMSFARHASDYMIFVDKGKIMEQGNTEKLFENPKTVELKSFINKILK